MAPFITEIQKFRHRGFKPNDGSATVMIFGNDPAPVNADGSAMEVIWDHDVVQNTTVSDHPTA